MEMLYSTKLIYQNDKIMDKVISIDKVKKKYRWRVNFDIMEDGRYYLEEFKKDRETFKFY
jgi:hypothetical protein